jgi:hypothetical protein
LRSVISATMVRRFFIFCSFFMATKDVLKALILTIIFVIIINDLLGKDDEEVKPGDKAKTGGSFNKKELETTILKLKAIQSTM